MTERKIMKCPKCNGEMEEGSPKMGFGGLPVWIKKGKMTIFGGPKMKSFACLKCGFIEGYVERN